MWGPGAARAWARRAVFFDQWAGLLDAGVPLVGALRHLSQHPPLPQAGRFLARAIEHIQSGATLTEALQASQFPLQPLERAVLQAGERSGRLVACLRLLADEARQKAALNREVWSGLAYPLFLLHFAVLVLALPEWVRTGDAGAYAGRVLSVLVPLHGAAWWILWWSSRERRGSAAAVAEALLDATPLLGSGRRALVMSRLAGGLKLLLEAGVSVLEAWPLAARACGSARLHRAVEEWWPRWQQGETPGETLRASARVPSLFADQYATGELTGRLDEVLGRLQHYYAEEARAQLKAFASWLPRLVYVLVACWIGWQVVQFWSAYFGQLEELLGP
ncbi:MAG: type II secretion system F family protein [Limisphaera sp.]|nr:type II secretion system F family protein [Limisphaera sp.]